MLIKRNIILVIVLLSQVFAGWCQSVYSTIDTAKKYQDAETILKLLDRLGSTSADTLSYAYNALGVIYNKRKNKDSCFYFAEKTLHLRKNMQTSDNSLIIKSYVNLILYSIYWNQKKDVIEYCKLLLDFPYEEIRYLEYFQSALIRELREVGDFRQALDYATLFMTRSTNIEVYLKNKILISEILILDGRKGSLEKAIKNSWELITIVNDSLRGLEQWNWLVSPYQLLGFAHEKLKDYPKSLQYYNEAEKYSLKQLTHPELVVKRKAKVNEGLWNIRSNKANVYRKAEMFSEAVQSIGEIISNNEQIYTSKFDWRKSAAIDNLGAVYEARGLLDSAQLMYLSAIANVIKKSVNSPESLIHEDLTTSDKKRKLLIYLNNVSRINQKKYIQNPHSDLLNKVIKMAHHTEAIVSSLLNSSLAKESRRTWQLEASENYHRAYWANCEKEHFIEALVWSEKAKGLLARMFAQSLENQNCLPSELRDSLQNLKELITQKEKEVYNAESDEEKQVSLSNLLDARNKKSKLLVSLQRDFVNCNFGIYQDQSLTLSALDQLIQGHVLVNIVYLEDSVSFLVYAEKQFREYRVSVSELINPINAFIHHIGGVKTISEKEIKEVFSRLHDKIWAPLKINSERVVIVPDGLLSYIPFESLWNGNYLIFNHEISYSYSLLMLDLQQKRKILKNDFLAVVPNFTQEASQELVFRGTQLVDLPMARKEAEEIAEIMNGTLLVGEGSKKEEAILACEEAGIIHFASHAIVDDHNVDYSCLFFQPEQEDSLANRLYLNDLYALHLPVKMVVLSACETGIGEYLKGEGMLSLASGFTQAGANAVVTSLWRADDQSTFHIMTGFYNHLNMGMTKSSALRRAKLDYLKNADPLKTSPVFWATFVPIGDMSPVCSPSIFNSTVILSLLVLISLISIFLYSIKKGRDSSSKRIKL